MGVGHFTFWIRLSLSGIATCTHRPQGVITVGVYMSSNILLFIIIIILKQKGVTQLADV